MSHRYEKINFMVEVFIVYENIVIWCLHDTYKICHFNGKPIELDADPTEQ